MASLITHVMWEIEVLPEAARDLEKLDRQHANRILKFLHERVSKLHDPRTIGAALKGVEIRRILEISSWRLPHHQQNRR